MIRVYLLDQDTDYINTRYKNIRRIYIYYKKKPIVRIDIEKGDKND